MRFSIFIKIAAILAGLTAALGAGYYLGNIRSSHRAPEVSAVATAAKVKYTCSMHPFIIRDEPGSCPICGMTLTPVKNPADNPGNAATSDSAIRIDPVTLQNMGVRIEPVVREPLHHTVRTVGLVTYEENKQFSVNAKVAGWVEKLYVNQSGQPVKKGQPLLELYSPDLVAAQQEYLLAAANHKRLDTSPYPEIAAGADRLLDAARTRLRYWDISDSQIRAMEKSGQVRKTMTLFSEYDGIVTGKKVLEGMQVSPGEELMQIANLASIWVNADIYEYELPWIRVGQEATVELPFGKDVTLQGKITYLYPYLENQTRTVKARIELPNHGQELKPDMYVNVSVVADALADALTVPVPAVLNSGQRQTVFIALGEGRFEPRAVKSGLHDDNGRLQIVEGLSEGEQVVVSAQFMLDSESKLREALQKMTEPGKQNAVPTAPKQPAAKKEALDDLFK